MIAKDLQKLEVKRVSNQKCRAVHGDPEQIAITEPSQNLCAGGEEGNESHFLNHMLCFVKTIYNKFVRTRTEKIYI